LCVFCASERHKIAHTEMPKTPTPITTFFLPPPLKACSVRLTTHTHTHTHTHTLSTMSTRCHSVHMRCTGSVLHRCTHVCFVHCPDACVPLTSFTPLFIQLYPTYHTHCVPFCLLSTHKRCLCAPPACVQDCCRCTLRHAHM
jgi:hypothetical protein